MRSFEEVREDILLAVSRSDVPSLHALVQEMQALGTPSAEAHAQHALGTAHALTGDFSTALEHYRRALAMHEAQGVRAGVASVTGNMGNMYFSTGDNPSALEHYRRALTLHEELGNRPGAASITSNLGNLYFSTGDFPTALQHYRRALEMYEELGNHAGVASAIGNIGGVYYSTDDHPTALEYYRRALAMHEEQGNLGGMAGITGNIGLVLKSTDDNSSALEHLRHAFALYEEIGNSAGIVFIMGIMIATLGKLGRYDEAAELLERQATMPMESPNVAALHLYNKALLADHEGDHDAEQRYLLEALSITTEAGLRSDAVEYHAALRDFAQKRNDFAGYIEHNNAYQRITEEIRGKEATQRMAMMEAERRMEGERRERDKERALLYGALPRSVADRMIRGEDVSGDHFDHAAVMFLDIVCFTSHTSTMPPSDVVKMLENIFRTIDTICDTCDVVKVKTIGDSYMCFRGDADATSNALSIAHVALDVMQHAFTWPNGEPLLFRVGIHIGPATAGVIGTQRLQYDVWGDTVNVASRMESTGEPGKVHVSEAFAIQLKANTEYTIQNSISESSNSESHEVSHEVSHSVSHEVSHTVSHSVSHEVSLVTRNSSLVTPLVPRHLSLVTIERGSIDIKGKGPMRTYWLERAS